MARILVGIRLSIALLVLGGSSGVGAACLTIPDPSLASLQALVLQNPAKAIGQTHRALQALQPANRADAARAALYALQAESYSLLELDADARETALKGLALTQNPHDPVRLRLLATYSENVYDDKAIGNAIATIETARAAQNAGSVADTCLLITLGRLQFRQNLMAEAIHNLTQAYRASSAPSQAAQRVLAASALAPVMRTMGDYSQALSLNQEVIDWDTQHNATLSLSVSRFLQGSTLLAMGELSKAIDAYAEARKLSVQLEDQQGIAFVDLNTCEAEIKLGRVERAKPLCANALALFTASKSHDVVKQARVQLAHIDLIEGRAEQARATLNEVLDQDGTDVGARHVASMYQLRARANAALGNYANAYGDLEEHVRRYVATNDADRSLQAAALRARFETDREIERNASLKQELTRARERAQRQKELLRWTTIAVAAGALVIGLLTYILVATRRHRRQLSRLARLDELTELPNRRYTGQLASDALSAALAQRQLLTFALLDLDRFKTINDRCGHAAGDHVLKEFAKIGRNCVRATDIFGRWGGEEFLLVMPDTTLDTALVVLERLRAEALAIVLPASGVGLRVTLSAGLATTEENVSSLDDIVARADTALYRAKNQGRDLVRIAEESYQTASTGVRRAVPE